MLESAFLNLQTVLIGAVLGLLTYFILRRSRYRLPPSPPCWLIIGHYKIYTSKEMHRKAFEVSQKYGPVITINTGGSDSTRITLDWFMCFMSGLPEIKRKCREEIDRNTGNRLPSMKDRGNLDYTEACLYETMRLGAVAALGVPHKTICDTQVCGYDVPKDTTVLVNHWALHHDSRYWEDDEKFDPNRYLDENGKLDTKPESWLPFSAGRRVCLGEPLAKPEILLMIAYFLQRFEIRLPVGVASDFWPKIHMAGLELPKDYKVALIEHK